MSLWIFHYERPTALAERLYSQTFLPKVTIRSLGQSTRERCRVKGRPCTGHPRRAAGPAQSLAEAVTAAG